MKPKGGYVYIMSNKNRTVLYIGVTSNLQSRVLQHETGAYGGFTKQYNCSDLLYYEFFDHIESAIVREKAMKKWNREWKNNLIKEFNPGLKRLNEQIDGFN